METAELFDGPGEHLLDAGVVRDVTVEMDAADLRGDLLTLAAGR
jgi:hypothetical protein